AVRQTVEAFELSSGGRLPLFEDTKTPPCAGLGRVNELPRHMKQHRRSSPFDLAWCHERRGDANRAPTESTHLGHCRLSCASVPSPGSQAATPGSLAGPCGE